MVNVESTCVTHVPIVIFLHRVSMRHRHTLWSIPNGRDRACSQDTYGGTSVEIWCTSTPTSIPRSSASTSTSSTTSSIVVPSILCGYIDLVDGWGLPLLWWVRWWRVVLNLPWRDVLHLRWGIVLWLHWHTGLCRWWAKRGCHVRWWHDCCRHGGWYIGLVHRHVGKLLE